jgi:hypothetical protein
MEEYVSTITSVFYVDITNSILIVSSNELRKIMQNVDCFNEGCNCKLLPENIYMFQREYFSMAT